MDRLSPSLWLLGATHETIVAKQAEPASPKLLTLAPVSPAELEPAQTSNVRWPHNEWVEIVGYRRRSRRPLGLFSRADGLSSWSRSQGH